MKDYERLYVPSNQRLHIIKRAHENGHLGIENTSNKIKSLFWWPKLNEGVKNFVSSCPGCQRHKNNERIPKFIASDPQDFNEQWRPI